MKADDAFLLDAAKAATERLSIKQVEREALLDQLAELDNEMARLRVIANIQTVEKKHRPERRTQRFRAPGSGVMLNADSYFTNAFPAIQTALRKYKDGLKQSELLHELRKNGTKVTPLEVDQNLQAGRVMKKVYVIGRRWLISPDEIPEHLRKT